MLATDRNSDGALRLNDLSFLNRRILAERAMLKRDPIHEAHGILRPVEQHREPADMRGRWRKAEYYFKLPRLVGLAPSLRGLRHAFNLPHTSDIAQRDGTALAVDLRCRGS